MSEHIKPRFEVHKLEGTGTRIIAKPKTDDKGKLLGGFDYEDVESEAGWMVYFPNGASIHIWTKDEMERQNFLTAPGLVDMESDEEERSPASLKARSEQKTNASKNDVHHTT